ncbi:MAG: multi-sensor hybrid histidine kinase [Chloroflexi bacterium]|nr:multi-sensor hybrid histidine kinase [Chloroflexota bacterium]
MSSLTKPDIPASFLAWWAAQKARPNYGEFAQALLRVGIGVILLSAYYAWVDWSAQTWVRYLCWGFVTLSFVLFAWIYRQRESSDLVRFLTLAVDMGTPTILLGLTGERSAILVFVYTWVAVGHGFRFGLRYLHVAWIVSLVAFVLVYGLSAAVDGYWYQHPLVWLGAFFWIGAPTFYVAQLLKQKLVAVQAAEEARAQVERAQAEAERERVERARAEAERARAEAEAASEAKSEFLATMSHEMRTPLNGVVGAAEMLAARDLPQQERQLVDWLLASSRQLRSLIDNLLDLRKIEAGKILIERAPLDLHILMNHLVALFEPEAKRAHLRFTKSVSLDAPYLLIGDDARIQQVLINLTANALKFTRQGFVRVSAASMEHTDHAVKLRFEVRDTGIGIAPQHAERIFERFTQANATIHRQYGGSGLGTTICKHLVELMGGEIGFDSEAGKGSLFWFTVPLSRQPAEAYEEGAGVAIRGAGLIVVSSRPGMLEWATEAACERQMECTTVITVDEAVARVPEDARPEWCALLIDGEDIDLDWREAPNAVRAAGRPLPCILVHPDCPETDAFDAGYICVLRTRDPRLLSRAIRTVVAGASSPRPLAETPGPAPLARPGLHLLVAEDNQISQQIIAMMLQGGGHHVTVASDGESALDKYEQTRFDLVILDMNMPGRTGLEVAKAIRVLEATGRGARVPIIMLTAAASIDLQEDSEDAGIDVFLAKPVDPRSLLRAVDHAYRTPLEPSGKSYDTPSHAQTQDGYIDHVLLRDMARFSNDPAFVQTLTRQFSKDARQLIDEIEAALVDKDYEQFRELAHALKGSSMMAGAIRLGDSAARAEKITNRNVDSVDNEVISDLRKTFEATQIELFRMFAPQSAEHDTVTERPSHVMRTIVQQ